jgi:hypothetical protein
MATVDTSGLNQLNAFLDNVEDDFLDIDDVLYIFSKDILSEMIRKAPKKTGALMRSIKVLMQNNKLVLSMYNYGAFQNYGVSGLEDNKGKPVPTNYGLPVPSSGNTYKFTKRKYGIDAKLFFNIEDIYNKYTDLILKTIEPDK